MSQLGNFTFVKNYDAVETNELDRERDRDLDFDRDRDRDLESGAG